MTGEMTKLEALQNKFSNICDENALTYRFHRDSYPIRLVVRPDASPGGQLSMLENAGQSDTGFISEDASITFEYKDGALKHQMVGRFDLTDALFSKLKALFTKMHYLWLQHFNREVITNDLLATNAWQAINFTPTKKDGGFLHEADDDDDDDDEDEDEDPDYDGGDDDAGADE